MAEIIKSIPVSGKEEAVSVMNALTDKYQLVLTDPDNSLDASSEKLHAYYDADSGIITIETNDSESVGERLKELLMDFPTFF
jgi:hypothetical protein